MKKLPYILLIGGGSGGHVLPIIMLAERFGDRVLWIGEWRNSFDQKKARDHSIAFYGVPSVKIRKYAPWTFLTQPLYGLIAFFMTCIYLLRNRPKVIFSKGG